MNTTDARSVSAEAQEDLLRRVIPTRSPEVRPVKSTASEDSRGWLHVWQEIGQFDGC